MRRDALRFPGRGKVLGIAVKSEVWFPVSV